MFIEYDARNGLNNQEITPEQIVLDFKPLQVNRYEDLSTSVLANLASMQDNDSVNEFVQLCAIEINFFVRL